METKLRIDITVEAGGGHGKECAQQINVQILFRVDKRLLAGAEGKENWAAENKAANHQNTGTGKQQSKGVT